MAFQTQPVIRILTRNSRVHSCQVRHRRIEWRQRTVNSSSSEMPNAKRMEFNLLISKLIVDKVLILSYQLDPGLRDDSPRVRERRWTLRTSSDAIAVVLEKGLPV